MSETELSTDIATISKLVGEVNVDIIAGGSWANSGLVVGCLSVVRQTISAFPVA